MKLDHINITASNLEETRTFYQNVFDLPLAERGEDWCILGEQERFFIAMSKGESQKERGSLKHFGVFVEDFENFFKKIKKLNVKITPFGGLKSQIIQDLGRFISVIRMEI